MEQVGSMVASVGLGVATGVAALMGARRLPWQRRTPAASADGPPPAEPRRFVFRNGYLIEHTGGSGFLLPAPVDHLRAWDDLAAALDGIVAGSAKAMRGLREGGRAFRVEGRFGGDAIHVLGARDGTDLHVTVAAHDAEDESLRVGVEGLRCMQAEVALLSGVVDSSPVLSWVVDPDGQVVWGNGAYKSLALSQGGDGAAQGWPLPALFPLDGTEGAQPRRRIVDGAGRTRWFDLAPPTAAAGGARQMHASPVDATVAAERSLDAFIQTLTKTFAHLPTGLAIFDREQRLVMFNPALVDMTGLDPQWLSRRPRIADFFDRLRDRRKLPEPRDYKAWRDRLSDLARVDGRGTYRETWTLPTGQTYVVTGRPQADGAVALMLEDETAGLSAASRDRADRETLAAALGIGGGAVFVFAAGGRAIGASTASAGRAAPPAETLEAAIGRWADAYRPSPAWAELRACAGMAGEARTRAAWSGILRRDDGGRTTMRILPIRTGGVAVAFEDLPAAPARTRYARSLPRIAAE